MAEQCQCTRCKVEVSAKKLKFVVVEDGKRGVLICDECLIQWGELMESQLYERLMFMAGVV